VLLIPSTILRDKLSATNDFASKASWAPFSNASVTPSTPLRPKIFAHSSGVIPLTSAIESISIFSKLIPFNSNAWTYSLVNSAPSKIPINASLKVSLNFLLFILFKASWTPFAKSSPLTNSAIALAKASLLSFIYSLISSTSILNNPA